MNESKTDYFSFAKIVVRSNGTHVIYVCEDGEPFFTKKGKIYKDGYLEIENNGYTIAGYIENYTNKSKKSTKKKNDKSVENSYMKDFSEYFYMFFGKIMNIDGTADDESDELIEQSNRKKRMYSVERYYNVKNIQVISYMSEEEDY